jgi:hypothetical protein
LHLHFTGELVKNEKNLIHSHMEASSFQPRTSANWRQPQVKVGGMTTPR